MNSSQAASGEAEATNGRAGAVVLRLIERHALGSDAECAPLPDRRRGLGELDAIHI